LTDYGFNGYPLRKDFPLIGFNELRFNDLHQSIFIESLKSTQKFRLFNFRSYLKIFVGSLKPILSLSSFFYSSS